MLRAGPSEPLAMCTCMMYVAADARSKRKASLAENPERSLPAHMQSWKESQALYRFLDEPEVTFAAEIVPHVQQSREQANASRVVLLLQETADIDLF
jgi:Transposase DNA-binding